MCAALLAAYSRSAGDAGSLRSSDPAPPPRVSADDTGRRGNDGEGSVVPRVSVLRARVYVLGASEAAPGAGLTVRASAEGTRRWVWISEGKWANVAEEGARGRPFMCLVTARCASANPPRPSADDGARGTPGASGAKAASSAGYAASNAPVPAE